jgi:hypothetical protein
MQQKHKKFATPQTSNKCMLAALAFCSFSSAGNETWFTMQNMMLLVWQHTLSYFCKQVLVIGYV